MGEKLVTATSWSEIDNLLNKNMEDLSYEPVNTTAVDTIIKATEDYALQLKKNKLNPYKVPAYMATSWKDARLIDLVWAVAVGEDYKPLLKKVKKLSKERYTPFFVTW